MPDFTHVTYRELLGKLRELGYAFHTFEELGDGGRNLGSPHVLLRHDVDRMPRRSLALARLEHEKGVRSTYFFRTKPISFDLDIMSEVKRLGHEIGYHYETLSDAKGDRSMAWDLFRRELALFAPFGGVASIAMHGRPFSRWDNRDLWQDYDYREVGIGIEAYRDIDWNRYRYFTDTGRRWDGVANIRDKVDGPAPSVLAKTTPELMGLLRDDVSDAVISIHPERWTNDVIGLLQASTTDGLVNIAKAALRVFRRKSNHRAA